MIPVPTMMASKLLSSSLSIARQRHRCKRNGARGGFPLKNKDFFDRGPEMEQTEDAA